MNIKYYYIVRCELWGFICEINSGISQFADDTSVILDGSEESLNETLLELEWFKKISGLKINFSKTQVIWIGSKKYSSDRLCENWNLSWGKTMFTVLGKNLMLIFLKLQRSIMKNI